VAKIPPESLPRLPNLHWLGGKSYAELPAYLSGWDVGFMPFALNESTRFISPTKTPEFLAAGLPVVSTPVLDVVRDWGEAGLVDIATGPAAFADALGRALAKPRTEWLRAVDRRLAEISWDRTWEEMRLKITDAQRVGAASSARTAEGASANTVQEDAQHV
jgi:UDP-galactopyranose mutase